MGCSIVFGGEWCGATPLGRAQPLGYKKSGQKAAR
jgi:hypothetical protein